MTSKEALERLGAEKLARGPLIRNDDKVEPYVNCIKQDLSRLEKVEKAIEILKNKPIMMYLVNKFKDYNKYLVYVTIIPGTKILTLPTEEEWNLLKEVFVRCS